MTRHSWSIFQKLKKRFLRWIKHEYINGYQNLSYSSHQDKGDDVCGSSAWKAARGDSYSKRNINITGLEMMSCTHGTVVYSANLFKGETYKHTYLQHLKAYEKGTKFFCNDVICKYWPFAVKVGNLFADSNPEYKKLTQDMVPFLSRSHGLGHFWACRVHILLLLTKEIQFINNFFRRFCTMDTGRKMGWICWVKNRSKFFPTWPV